MPCDKLTKAKGLFIDRNGDLTVCSGLPINVGNIFDKDIENKLMNSKILSQVRNIYQNLEGQCGKCVYAHELNVCYGCRGNAFTYNNNKNIFLNDPMCFGKVALNLGNKKLQKFMSNVHIQRLKESYNGG